MVTHKQYLVDLVHARAADGGAGIAVEQGTRRVSYGELSRLVGERAHELRAHGAEGAVVAIERPKAVEFIADYLAVLAVGGVVVPLDPDLPPARRGTFVELARPQFLLGAGAPAALDGRPHPDLPDEGAFVYFTSGSTGIPKPVLGSARGVSTFAAWFGPRFGFGADDRFAFLAGVSFEAGLRDIFPPLSVGATLVIPSPEDTGSPESTVDWLAEKQISVVTAVPSVARGWLRHARQKCASMRAVFFVGEPLTADVQADWYGVFPGTEIQVNSYGSTESGQGTVFRQIPVGERFSDRVPAGRPVPGTRFCLIPPEAPLDAGIVAAALADPAAAGEIVLVSRSCSHGYLGMPAENAVRFADLGDAEVAYRTGDLGRVDEQGELVVIGRADDEVKINGVRVHPAEVTRALRSLPAVADGFVVAVKHPEPRLTAYVVLAAGASTTAADLRLDLLDVLPLAMIPSRFVEVAHLPVARTGKVDRASLTALAERDAAAAVYVAPDGEIECWLADRFAELLGVSRVSATDDLFALGGDSITATRLSSRIADDLGVELSQRAIFAAATVTGVAAAVLREQLLHLDSDELTAMLDSLDSA
ncbi:acyl-coenzyme A synthetase/AMP-(fatty) acid ligase/acyl carrier protein [Allocatelliglobosispora scoriae]|uniref:Acyl-coenzyme A synthetase/AMP-(Fatty) acid ligase/acyl carrier protein n=1 Tax=Allocatelliglobosispora scoriae TaxID=643052 RepID=A0A841BHX8_9ACTN|nr:non-ribosomal peptide synthetase [Allocatelliglobosispora scoriae]MBB5867884.1 acyl-coenzyme A synthetase/AMP-(fatty) acid ligase/acyl carrier protein [Allocatelliglobosispora scoriae]